MGDNNKMGSIFLKELVRAIPWGIVILIVLFISIGFLGRTLKNSIEFAQGGAVITATGLIANPEITELIKQNIKEGIEYSLAVTKREVKSILKDPQLKQDVKEALEYAGKQLKLRDRNPDISKMAK